MLIRSVRVGSVSTEIKTTSQKGTLTGAFLLSGQYSTFVGMEEENNEKSTSRKAGKGMIRGDQGNTFSSDNQPSPEAKKEGQRRYWNTRALLNSIAKGKLSSKKDFAQMTADFMDIPLEEVTVSMIMDFRMVQKAISKMDSQAYKAVKDRAFGRPAEEHPAITDQPKDEKNKIVLPGGFSLDF